jgi:hypothetical protein
MVGRFLVWIADSMLEFFRDPVWQFIGAIVGIVAIVITLVLYSLQRRRKALSYEIVSCEPLISKPGELEGNLQIVFGGQLVREVYLLIIKITNSGNQPIESSNYERSLTLSVDAPARILTAQITETNPPNLAPQLLPDGSGGWHNQLHPELALDTYVRTIPLKRTLLNPGDSFKIKMLLSEFTPSRLYVTRRIVGVKDIEKVKARQGRPLLLQLALLPLAVLVSLALEWGESQQPIKRYLAVFILAVIAAWIVVETWRDVKRVWKALQDKD